MTDDQSNPLPDESESTQEPGPISPQEPARPDPSITKPSEEPSFFASSRANPNSTREPSSVEEVLAGVGSEGLDEQGPYAVKDSEAVEGQEAAALRSDDHAEAEDLAEEKGLSALIAGRLVSSPARAEENVGSTEAGPVDEASSDESPEEKPADDRGTDGRRTDDWGTEVNKMLGEGSRPKQPGLGKIALVSWGIVWLALAAAIGIYGWQLRTQTTADTVTVRFPHDLNNSLNQTREVRDDALAMDRAAIEQSADKTAGYTPEQIRLVWDRWPTDQSFWKAYWGRYDKVVAEDIENNGGSGDYKLDYGPLRLLGLCLWQRYVVDPPTAPAGKPWKQGNNGWSEEDLKPLMLANRVGEMIAAISAMGLVWIWRRRAGCGQISTGFASVLAGGLLWMNLAVISVGHVWAQWDVWAVAFYLLAAFLATANCWAWAGAVIATGCLMKGQILLGAPILVLWPMFMLRWKAAVGIIAGFALALALWTIHWTVPQASWTWLLTVAIGAAVMSAEPLVARLVGRWFPRLKAHGIEVAILVLCVAICVLWPWAGIINVSWSEHFEQWIVVFAAVALFGLVLLIRPGVRKIGWSWVALIAAGSLWLAAGQYGGNLNWARVGLLHGTDHYRDMSIGTVANFPAILKQSFGVGLTDPLPSGEWMAAQIVVVFVVGVLYIASGIGLATSIYRRGRACVLRRNQLIWLLGGAAALVGVMVLSGYKLLASVKEFAAMEPADTRQVLRGLYVVLMLVMAGGLALQTRTKQVWGLAAIGGIWVVAFTFLPQMHERYLMYGAAATAIFAGINLGMALLHLLITLAASAMIWSTLARLDTRFQPWIMEWTSGMMPGLGWGVLVMAFVVLWLSIAWRTRRMPNAA